MVVVLKSLGLSNRSVTLVANRPLRIAAARDSRPAGYCAFNFARMSGYVAASNSSVRARASSTAEGSGIAVE